MDKKTVLRILKNTNVNFFLGAGASFIKQENGDSFPLMSDLLCAVNEFVKAQSFDDFGEYKDFIDRILAKLQESNANIEEVLSKLIGFSSYLDDNDLKRKELFQKFVNDVLHIITDRIYRSNKEPILPVYKKFYNNLKYVFTNANSPINVFTTNYDLLNEESLDAIGMHYYSGFYGTVIRKFVPQYYNSNYVDFFGVDKTNYQINQQHINLFKLHGSLSWKNHKVDGIETVIEDISDNENPVIIYPSINKYNDTNEVVVFTTLQRLLSQKLSNRTSSLFVIGSSLSDQHINKIIENSLLDSTFNLLLFPFDEKQRKEFQSKFTNNNRVMLYDEDGITLSRFTEMIAPNSIEEVLDEQKD